jgi:drug/metabolite transporter (DMT)-like permease
VTPDPTVPQSDTRRQIIADASLVFVALIWGATFVLVKDVIEQVPTMLFLAMRFTFAGVALALVMLPLRRWSGLTRAELGWGTVLGVALYSGYTLQTLGLRSTTASNGGFITGLSVVLVPVLGIFVLRQVPRAWSWLGVLFATTGLALLSLNFDTGVRINEGDALVFGCAIAFAIHILLVSKVAGGADPLRLTLVQIIVTGVLSALTSILFEPTVSAVPSGEVWAGTIFLGVAATAFAITIQVTVQRFTSAVHTVLIFTLEPVFAAAFGMWLQGDRLGPIAWGGAGLILTGMLVAELGSYLVQKVRARGIIPVPEEPPASQARTDLSQTDVSPN